MKSLILSLAIGALLPMAACASDTPNQPVAEPYTAALETTTGRPVVNVMINGQGPYPFIFDTGAGTFVIGTELVEELNLEVVGTSRLSSPGGEGFDVDLIGIDSLDLGGAIVQDITASQMDVGPREAIGAVGVIGPSMFEAFGRVAFDFNNYSVEVGGDFTTTSDSAWIEFGESAPLLDGMLSTGDVSIPIHLDTGSPGIASLPRSFADELPLDGPIEVVGRGRLVDRDFVIEGAPMSATLSLGEASIPVSSVHFVERSFGNIGMGALHGLTLEIDWDADRYALAGTAEPREPVRRRRQAPAPSSE
jgi:hypothetical protein